MIGCIAGLPLADAGLLEYRPPMRFYYDLKTEPPFYYSLNGVLTLRLVINTSI